MADRVKEKLSGLLYEASRKADPERYIFDQIADYLIAHGVTVRNEPIKVVIPGDIDEKVLMETIRNSHMQILPGETLQEWISVKDRLPDKEGTYIVHGNLGGVFSLFYDEMLSNSFKQMVTHWMPLPEPPKGE